MTEYGPLSRPGGVAGTGVVEDGGTLRGGPCQRLVEERLDMSPAVGGHGSSASLATPG